MLKRLKGRERQLWEGRVLTAGGYRYESEVFRNLEAQGRAEGEAKGRAEGEAKALLRVLDRRAVPITDADRSRIMACTDPAVLDLWLDRAVDAKTIDDVFVE